MCFTDTTPTTNDYGINKTSQNSTPAAKGTQRDIPAVTAVRVSPDLSVARAYLSVFPSDKGAAMLESINASARTVRYELAQRVRFQLRKTPELTFMLDDSLDYIENIDHLLEK